MSHKQDTEIAEVWYEAYRSFCISLGSQTQVPWDGLLKVDKDTATHQVRSAIHVMSTIGEDKIHSAWRSYMIDRGWIRGSVDCKVMMTSTILANELTLEERVKANLLFTIVRVMSE